MAKRTATKKRKTSGARKTAPTRKTARARKTASKRPKAAKRELIDTGTDKRFVRRDSQGQFKESDDVGRSLAQDRRQRAKTVAPKGQGDRGDRAK